MHIKELYKAWKKSGFTDNDVKKSFERGVNTSVVIDLIMENEGLKEILEEISESDCLGDISKILRRCGIDA